MGTTTDYFVGLWRGVAVRPTQATKVAKSASPTAQPYVMWNVRLIGEALSDRSHVAAFREQWYRKDRSLRCTRSGTLRFLDGALILRVRKNDCTKHWDELERPTVRQASAGSVVLTLTNGEFRYRWLRNSVDR